MVSSVKPLVPVEQHSFSKTEKEKEELKKQKKAHKKLLKQQRGY